MATQTPPPSAKQVPPKSPQKAAAGAPRPASSQSDANAATPLGRVVVRNEFYRDGYRTLLRVAFIEAVAIVGLIIAIVAIVNAYQPENRYFATTEDGRVVPMVPLSDPNLSRAAVLSWAAQSAAETYTFGFSDYRRRLQESSRHFTRKGWASFVKALQDSGQIEAVEKNRQIYSATLRSAPTVLSEGLVRGVYQWQIELPMLITVDLGSGQKSMSMNIQLIVVRVPRLESPNGLGIEQWVAFTAAG
jgi:intracellular multiplication protein IcmL